MSEEQRTKIAFKIAGETEGSNCTQSDVSGANVIIAPKVTSVEQM